MDKVDKPKLLDPITVLMGILNLFAFSMNSGADISRSIEIAATCVIVIFSFWVLYKFNKGVNWARILVLIVSVIALLNLIAILDCTRLVQIVILTEALLAIYLLYWLNRESVKKYFHN